MKKYLVLILFICSMASKAQKVTEGSRLPSFKLQDQHGQWLDAQDLKGQALVIYFYPKDDTPGCTKEACSFRDQFEAFSDKGACVIGISADDVASHKAFAEKYRLPFTLLSDPGNQVRKAFGVPADLFGLIPGRVTYIFNASGVCVKMFNSQLNAEKHITESLNAL